MGLSAMREKSSAAGKSPNLAVYCAKPRSRIANRNPTITLDVIR